MSEEKKELIDQTKKAMEKLDMSECQYILGWAAAKSDERMKQAEEKKKED